MAKGRPTKLSLTIQAKIVHAIEVGAYYEHAAGYAGISKVTLYSWLDRGGRGEQPFEEFLNAVKCAEGRSVVEGLEAIRSAQGGVPGQSSADVWTNRAWMLERRHPRLYGRTVVEQQDGGRAPLEGKSDAELDAIIVEEAAKIAARPLRVVGGTAS
jgi:hypothetical protein